ncbi:MAG: hypothetical protein JNJ73_11715 [Hyphomonadaceae bacterium]|nr:hypothetical protein [Hyphomonadaceae bacterium]
MVGWWWVVPGVVAALGVFLLGNGVRHVIGGKLFKGGRSVLGGGIAAAAGLGVGLMGLNVQTYSRLTYERPVALVSARQTGPQLFSVTMCEPQTGKVQNFEVHGDQWRLEAYVLKWQPWANVLGLDAQYELDRISGRYVTTEDELNAPRSAYDLAEAKDAPTMVGAAENPQGAMDQIFTKGINVLDLPEPLQKWAPAVDTRYGNGVFMPLTDGGVHQVWFTQDSLIARDGTAEEFAQCTAQGERPAGTKT